MTPCVLHTALPLTRPKTQHGQLGPSLHHPSFAFLPQQGSARTLSFVRLDAGIKEAEAQSKLQVAKGIEKSSKERFGEYFYGRFIRTHLPTTSARSGKGFVQGYAKSLWEENQEKPSVLQ